jgi:hypothetical protein
LKRENEIKREMKRKKSDVENLGMRESNLPIINGGATH